MSRSDKHVTIIGGGIIGLACAYYLVEDGYSVTVVDRNAIGNSCAFGNAGYISPSHFEPLSRPGMIRKGFQDLFDGEAAFHLKPRLDKDLWQWLWLFYRHCSAEHVSRVHQVLLSLCLESKSEYQKLWDAMGRGFQHDSKGLFILCRTTQALEHELALVEQANQLGLHADQITLAQLQQKYSDIQFDVKGGVFFADDAHVHPGELLDCLHRNLKAKGVEFIENCEVDSLCVKDRLMTKIGNARLSLDVDHLVIAGGCWTPQLARQLKLKIPLQAGKGYSVTQPQITSLDTPIILSEATVAITPLREKIRFGGTMELVGIDSTINFRRVNAVLKAVERYLPGLAAQTVSQTQAWCGLRPCSPDGMPFVGRVSGVDNLQIATGHAMLGLTLAPVTGKIIAQQLSANHHPALPFLLPERFG